MDIYWGAVPFVLIQIVMVVIVLAFPRIVGQTPLAIPEESIEIPMPADPNAGYLLPPDKR